MTKSVPPHTRDTGPGAAGAGAPDAPVIAELPELVRNQIAAGEVIERPASVVKELVENALDAGARQIQIDLEEGGIKLVRVVDDGVGMGPADLALAFRAHATSKLREVGDLDHIGSLGFRGEALASIGSVARCRLYSRRAKDELGFALEHSGGESGAIREAGGPAGTSVEVRDVFYNTPARRRFLKRTSTELSRCLDHLQRAALAHPGVGFVATHDGKRLFDVEAGMDLRDRVRRTFDAELAASLVPVFGEDGTTRLEGFVAPPRFSRRDTSRQMWFLNGRPLRDKTLIRALKDGYHGFLVEGRQPVAFLHLSMDPAHVDVNVHPTKAEVRFGNQHRLFGFLVNTLREAVRKTDIATPGETLLDSAARRGAWNPAYQPGQETLPNPGPLRGLTGRGSSGGEAVDWDRPIVREVVGRTFEIPRVSSLAPGGSGPATSLHGEQEDTWEAVDDLRGPYLQVAKTYLVRAIHDGFEIIDQHALHERLTYELMLRDVRAGKVEVQRLLIPELVEVAQSEVKLLEEHFESFAKLGIELSLLGETTVAVSGLPARLRRPDAEGLVRDLAELLRRTGLPPDAEDVLEEVLHSAACRSSIMAGDELTQDSIQELLERARELGSDQTCPHARPTRVRFTLSDLEKAFHRR